MSDPRAWVAGALAAILAVGPLQGAGSDPVLGEWLVAGGGAKVRISPCASDPARLCGSVTWLKKAVDAAGAPVRDKANPDPALRRRPIVGADMISDFRRAGPGHWVDGRIYDPDSGKTYRSKMAVTSDGALSVSGCVLVFCQAQTWTRVAN